MAGTALDSQSHTASAAAAGGARRQRRRERVASAIRAVPELVRRVERAERLDALAEPVTALVGRAVRPKAVRNVLSGTRLGHPLHPMLTDVPIGAWTMATVLDLLGGRETRRAADLLVAVGTVAAVPTAAAGLNDWSDTYGPETRVGLVHAAANTTALGLYAVSLADRLRSRRGRARVFGMAGFATMVAGGYLGGYLSFVLGVNTNHAEGREGPAEWTAVLAESDLADGQAIRVVADGSPVLLHRDGDRIQALSSVCSHAGGPLEEGTIADGCVTCPWHGSVFRLADGTVERGPASIAQPAYDTRVTGGKIEIRARG